MLTSLSYMQYYIPNKTERGISSKWDKMKAKRDVQKAKEDAEEAERLSKIADGYVSSEAPETSDSEIHGVPCVTKVSSNYIARSSIQR